MSATCSSCGAEDSVEEDSIHGDKQLVCTACGVVVDNNFLAMGELDMAQLVTPQQSHTLLNVVKLPSSLRNCVRGKYVCNGMKSGLNIIRMFTSHYHLPEYVAKNIQDLYEKAFWSDQVLHNSIKFKDNLAAACVYSIMRQMDWPISINNICCFAQCTKGDISLPMSLLSKHFDIKFQSPSVEELTGTFLNILNIMDEEEKESITNKTLSLLELSNECWLTTSRSPRACIFAAAFIAWKTLDPLRKKISAKAFCKKFEIKCQSSMTLFVQELKKTLLKLGEALPWLKHEVINQNNVLNYLDDILKYSAGLKFDVIEKYRKNSTDSDIKGLFTDEVGYHAFRKAPKRPLTSEPFNPNLSMTIDENEINTYICSESEVKFKKKHLDM